MRNIDLKEIEIVLCESESSIPEDLLLSADPSKEIIDTYLPGSTIFLAKISGITVGCCVVSEINKNLAEIKNIAVDSGYQNNGIGKSLLNHTCQAAQDLGYLRLRICTGNSSIHQLRLYQNLGFQIIAVINDHFTQLYPEPIFEYGMQCRDKVILEMQLV